MANSITIFFRRCGDFALMGYPVRKTGNIFPLVKVRYFFASKHIVFAGFPANHCRSGWHK
jgi:hypothetical protein